jgi:hypothetical protein
MSQALSPRFNMSAAQSNGILDIVNLEALLDNAYADYNFGYDDQGSPYNPNPPIFLGGSDGNPISHYGQLQLGTQLLDEAQQPMPGPDARYISTSGSTSLADNEDEFRYAQQNGGEFTFIAWDASGQVTDYKTIEIDNALGLKGYWPLFKTELEAKGYIGGNGSAHEHQFQNTDSPYTLTWYMPSGLQPNEYFHGNYPGQFSI